MALERAEYTGNLWAANLQSFSFAGHEAGNYQCQYRILWLNTNTESADNYWCPGEIKQTQFNHQSN